jgi:hypothetical protein
MADELNEDITDFIESISITSKKEALYIKKNNWADVKEAKFRADEFDLQNLLVERSLLHASSLFKLAKSDLRHPAVKKMLDELIDVFKIHGDRISKYILASDWTEQITEGVSRSDVKAEIQFQSEANKNLAKFKADVRKLNYSEESQHIDIPIFGDQKIPLLMNSILENRFPEITEMLKVKREKYYLEHPEKAPMLVEAPKKKIGRPKKITVKI